MYKLSVICILSVLVAQAYGACPNGWQESKAIQGKCYFFSRDNATMPEAQEYCEMLGKIYGQSANLVKVENAAVQQQLSGVMNTTDSYGYWIGLADIVVEDQFVWLPLGEAPMYTNWGPMQPNNVVPNKIGDENCVVLANLPKETPPFVLNWMDVPCWNINEFICEMREPIAAPVVG